MLRTQRKGERLETRMTREQKYLISRAAAIRGTSVTDFVVTSAQEAATEAIRDSQVLALRGEAQETFVRAMLNPSEPAAAATVAARRYKQLANK